MGMLRKSLHLYSDFCGRQFGAGFAVLQSRWALWTTERNIMCSGSMMLDLELKAWEL